LLVAANSPATIATAISGAAINSFFFSIFDVPPQLRNGMLFMIWGAAIERQDNISAQFNSLKYYTFRKVYKEY